MKREKKNLAGKFRRSAFDAFGTKKKWLYIRPFRFVFIKLIDRFEWNSFFHEWRSFPNWDEKKMAEQGIYSCKCGFMVVNSICCRFLCWRLLLPYHNSFAKNIKKWIFIGTIKKQLQWNDYLSDHLSCNMEMISFFSFAHAFGETYWNKKNYKHLYNEKRIISWLLIALMEKADAISRIFMNTRIVC